MTETTNGGGYYYREYKKLSPYRKGSKIKLVLSLLDETFEALDKFAQKENMSVATAAIMLIEGGLDG